MDILYIAKKINNCGGKIYLVGGAVRDMLLGINIHDEDYCVVGLDESKFEELFPTANARGKSFKVYDIDCKEFALARTEIKSGLGHKNFEITTGKHITIEQDLARRDITINSIAKDILTNKIIDPYNGQDDLKKGIIRATTEKFKEDPLRAYRVARFAAQFGFKVEENTIELMNNLKNELATLSKERVFIEFKKALSTDKPSIFFETLKKADILDVHFKEIYNLIGAEQPIQHHSKGDTYNHTLIVIDQISKNTQKLEIRFSGLVHDLGKGITPKEEYLHQYDYDKKGIELVKKLGNRIKVPKTWIKCGKVAVAEHMNGGNFFKMTPKKQVMLIEKMEKSLLGLEGLQLIVDADKGINVKSENFASLGKQLLEEINGKYIIKKYGKLEGVKFKEKLFEERVNGINQKPHLPD